MHYVLLFKVMSMTSIQFYYLYTVALETAILKQKINEYNNKYGPYNRCQYHISHNNNCILHGYRNNITFKTVLCNLFWKHNELCDIIIDYIFVIIEIIWFIYLCNYTPLETKVIIVIDNNYFRDSAFVSFIFQYYYQYFKPFSPYLFLSVILISRIN